MGAEDREQIIKMLSERMDFSFREEDLSPKLRREIGQITKAMNHYYGLDRDLVKAKTRANMEIFFAVILFSVGLITFWFSVWFGTISFAGGVLVVWAYTKERRQVKDKEVEVTSLWSALDNRIEQLSKQIYKGLTLLHEAKLGPTVKHIVVDFASIIQAARGRGIILNNIECPHCNGVVEIPPTGEFFKCQYCGKTVHATKIFDKLKDILTPS